MPGAYQSAINQTIHTAGAVAQEIAGAAQPTGGTQVMARAEGEKQTQALQAAQESLQKASGEQTEARGEVRGAMKAEKAAKEAMTLTPISTQAQLALQQALTEKRNARVSAQNRLAELTAAAKKSAGEYEKAIEAFKAGAKSPEAKALAEQHEKSQREGAQAVEKAGRRVR